MSTIHVHVRQVILHRFRKEPTDRLSTVHERFLNYYGQRGARLGRNESVHTIDIHRKSSYLFLLVRPFLFYTPDIYIRKLDEIWVDNQVNEGPWNKFWNEIRRDWERTFTPVRCLPLLINVTQLGHIGHSPTFNERRISSYSERRCKRIRITKIRRPNS